MNSHTPDAPPDERPAQAHPELESIRLLYKAHAQCFDRQIRSAHCQSSVALLIAIVSGFLSFATLFWSLDRSLAPNDPSWYRALLAIATAGFAAGAAAMMLWAKSRIDLAVGVYQARWLSLAGQIIALELAIRRGDVLTVGSISKELGRHLI